MMDEQSAGYWASARDWSIRTVVPIPVCIEKNSISKAYNFLKIIPNPCEFASEDEGRECPMNMASGCLLPILKKLLAKDEDRKKLAEKYELMLSLDPGTCRRMQFSLARSSGTLRDLPAKLPP
jgi:hypothetical protein